jgi:hypothetical protein
VAVISNEPVTTVSAQRTSHWARGVENCVFTMLTTVSG